MFHAPNQYRLRHHPLMGSDDGMGNNGAFIIPLDDNIHANVIASDGERWEHVSVVVYDNGKPETPTWDEMCMIKDMFWDDTDCVIQYHPPKSEYVNNNEHCLHLWRPIGRSFPMPPSELVGIKN